MTAHNSPDVGLTAHGGSRPQQPPTTYMSSGSEGASSPTVRQQVLAWESRQRAGSRNTDRSKVTSRTIAKSRSPSVRSCRSVSVRDPPRKSEAALRGAVQDMAELRDSIETFTTQQVSSVAGDMAKLRSELDHVISGITSKISEDRSILGNLQHQAGVVQSHLGDTATNLG